MAGFEDSAGYPLLTEGPQWPEARSFGRVYGGNPYEQASLLRHLVGLHRVATNLRLGDAEAGSMAVKQTIAYFAEVFNDWRQTFEPGTLDRDIGYPEGYIPEDRLLYWVDAIMSGQYENDS